MSRPRKYREELLERGVRLALESERPIAHVVADLGIHPETLRKRVGQAKADAGGRSDLLTTQEREEIRQLRRENRAAARERDLEVGVGVFCQGAQPGPTEVSRYVNEHHGRFGVEPICRTLGVSASAYYERASGRRSARALEDQRLLERIRELHGSNYYAYGYRRMWKTLQRAGEQVPRCRVQRLMRDNGIQGAKRRGKPWRRPGPTRRPAAP